MSNPKVVFIVSEVGHYVEFKKILQSNTISSKIQASILFDRDGVDLESLFEKELKDCRSLGFKYFFLPKVEVKYPLPSRIFSYGFYLFDKVITKLKFPIKKIRSLFSIFLEASAFAAHFRKRIQSLHTFFESENIEAIVIGEENVLLDTFVYKMAAGERKVFVLPYTIPNPKEMATGAYKKAPVNSFKALVFSLLGGNFSKIIENTNYLLLSPSKILSFFYIGYRPHNPWILNDDTADLVLLESEEMAETYLGYNVKNSHFQVVGTLNDDHLVEMSKQKDFLKKSFQKKYSLNIHKPIVLVGFPPNQYPWSTAEFPDYATIIETYRESLTPFLENYSIVVTKHPRIKQSLESLAAAGIVVVEEPTIELLPFSYLYIASASATIRWAIASGIPVINYDVYRHFYEDYDRALAVKTVRAKNLFQNELGFILNDQAYYDGLMEQQKKDSHRWGQLDGQVAQRLVKILSR